MRPLEPEILDEADLLLPEVGSDLPLDDRPLLERVLETFRDLEPESPPSPSPERVASALQGSGPSPMSRPGRLLN